MHRAIDLLYCPCGVCLEKQKTKETRIDGTVWDRITEYIYRNKGFSSDMLTHKDVRALIDETATVLSYAISENITEETPEELIEQLEDNAYIFSGFKTYHSLSEVSLSMTDDNGRLKSFDTFRKDVEKINDKYNVRYLEAEYNQAVASAQMAARWANFSNDTKRYMLQYRTAQDNKVRNSHRALEGVTLDKNDAFWDSYLPPNGWGCRCTTVEVLAREYNKTDSEVAIKTAEAITYGKHERIFRFNPGKEKRLFPDKHPYFKANKEDSDKVKKVSEEEFLNHRIRKIIEELPNNLKEAEKEALAKHMIKTEEALGIKKGKPMSIEEADKQSANPNYKKDKTYRINCQTCAPAYVLRLQGFDVKAKANTKGSLSDYLSRQRSFEAWKNIDGSKAIPTLTKDWMEAKGYKRMTAMRYEEFFNEACKEEGVYILTIGWRGGGGHATILQRFSDGKLNYIEPQLYSESLGARRKTSALSMSGEMNPLRTRGVMRVDNKLFDLKFISIFDK